MNNQERQLLLSLFKFDKTLTDNQKIKKLYSISSKIEKNYCTFEIPKKSGGTRKIYSPNYYLKNVQKLILDEILNSVELSKNSVAYTKTKKLIDNARPHLNKNVIIKLDIKNFFESISFVDVYNIYKSLGFSKRIAGLLSYLSTYNDYLPQGAPTSPYLSNIFMKKFDEVINMYCESKSISYTRYADDMTFSSDTLDKNLIKCIKLELKKLGLELNKEKIHIIRSNNRQKVTGIIVNQKLQTDKRYRQKIRQEIYYISKFGIVSHLKHINYKGDPEKYINSLKGKINFVLQIDPENKEFKEYKTDLNKLTK